MELTDEQKAIIASTGNIRINAVAGSGKTTTIIEYARTRPKKSKILYLAFNKSVKLEAQKKFDKLGLTNVRVETAHSLAYKYTVIRFGYKVRAQGYRQTELVDVLRMHRLGERHAEYILANHVLRFAAYYCNSDALKLDELNYRDTLTDVKVKSFVNANYALLEKYTREFLRMMNSREIEITHDYYLKKFQLIAPKLKYDYILFDEGQDASPAMLDVFFSQDATKVIVGDRHQQIYGWRFAVNSLEKADYATYNLSTSFRFGENVAKLAMEVLKYKGHLLVPSSFGYAQYDKGELSALSSFGEPFLSDSRRAQYDNSKQQDQVKIVGAGKFSVIKSKAILARTNLGLLLKAIEYVVERMHVKKIYFEGNINSYTYAEDGTSLYDVLNLYLEKKHMIKDRLIRSMNDMEDLDKYIEKTGDPQLGMMVEIVEQYGDRIPGILAKIKSLHVENEKREEAEMIFSTVHRCKGLEYDEIELVSDFIKEDGIIKQKNDPKRKEPLDIAKITEEINLLYVAATRARVKIVAEREMLPKSFEPTEDIGPPDRISDPSLPTSTPPTLSYFDYLPAAAQSELRQAGALYDNGHAQHDKRLEQDRMPREHYLSAMGLGDFDEDDEDEDEYFDDMRRDEEREYYRRKSYEDSYREMIMDKYRERLREKFPEKYEGRFLHKVNNADVVAKPNAPSPEELEKIRKVHPGAYMPWTKELEMELKNKYERGVSITQIAKEMGRTKGAIEARLEKLNIKKAS